MGEQVNYFQKRFFATKSKRLRTHSPSNGAQAGSPQARPRSSLVDELHPKSDGSTTEESDETRPKEVLRSSGEFCGPTGEHQLIRQSATNQEFQEPPRTALHEVNTEQDVAQIERRSSPIKHIDDDDDDDEDDAQVCDDRGQENGRGVGPHDINASEQEGCDEPPSPEGAGARPESPTRSQNSHIETLTFHPDAQLVGGPPEGHRQRRPSESQTRTKLKDSKLFKATKAILLFRRATSSLGADTGGSLPPGRVQSSSSGLSNTTRSFVASFWPRQNTADNSTCTRSSRMDSLNSQNTNNFCNQSSSSFALLNGGGGNGTKNSSQLSLNQKGAAANQNQSHPEHHLGLSGSSSSFSLPRFIVPKMNALRLPIVCLIKSLDGELMREVFIHRYEMGQYIIDNLKVSLGMKDAKYFGLKVASSLDEQEDVRQPWLDLNESVYKQISKHSRVVTIKNGDNSSTGGADQTQHSTTKSVDFYLRIKYYPPNLARIQDLFLKQYLWLQLRRDLRLGKLTSSMNNLTYLMACVLQYELGDFKQELVGDKIPHMNILPNQDLIEQQAIEIWQNRLVGYKRHQVLMQFLRASVILETYGFDYYPVRDHQRQRGFLLGFNYAGIKTIRNGRIINHFRWHNLSKISYERRMIIFHIYPNENSKRKQILGFKCLSNEDCSNLYMRLLEQKYFFTVELTYFDKSIRRPSHLTESALGQPEQQQLSDWSAPVGAAEGHHQLEIDQSFGQSFDRDEFGDYDEEPPGEDPLREFMRKRSGGSGDAGDPRARLHAASACVSSRGKPAGFSCNCSECATSAYAPAGTSRLQEHTEATDLTSPVRGGMRETLIKSSSLQEADQRRYDGQADYRQEVENSRYFSNPNSPEVPPCCSGQPEVVGVASQSERVGRAHFQAPHPLQRQRSVSKYTPDFAFAPRDGATTSEQGTRTASQAAPSANYEPPPAQANHRTTPSQRLADWTEQILVQPASLIAGSGQWPTRAGDQPAERARRASVSGDLFMQAIRFCLLVLLMNFLLRLSDGISSMLVELLTFGAQTQQAAGQQQTSIFERAAHS